MKNQIALAAQGESHFHSQGIVVGKVLEKTAKKVPQESADGWLPLCTGRRGITRSASDRKKQTSYCKRGEKGRRERLTKRGIFSERPRMGGKGKAVGVGIYLQSL